MYDFVVVGSGPSSLAFVQLISKFDLKILVIEREKSIGGCHRVKRKNGIFTEHGPRVYGGNYLMFQTLLKDMNLDFYKLFKKYNFSVTQLGDKNAFTTFTIKELGALTLETLYLFFNERYGEDVSVKDMMDKYNFTPQSVDIIDRICRLTDGADYTRYTLNQFLQLFNQNSFYNFYQPKEPNDTGMFAKWKKYLEIKGVEFILDSEVIKVDNNSVKTKEKSYEAKNIILAIPPKHLAKLLNSSPEIENTFGRKEEVIRYLKDVSYIDYISITFQWEKDLKLKKIHGFPRSEWGVGYVVMSDYFDEYKDKTLISAIVTIKDKPSKRLGFTADEIKDPNIISEEVLSQLREVYDLPDPDKIVISPNSIYDNDKNQWVNIDNAYMKTPGNRYLSSKGKGNIYNIGTHNGNHSYAFTSLESAVCNGIHLAKEFYPKLNKKFYNRYPVTVKNVLVILLIVLSIILLIYKRVIPIPRIFI